MAIDWKAIRENYSIKYAEEGTYKTKVKGVEISDLDQWDGANVDIKFEPVNGIVLPNARYRLRLGKEAKANWRAWQHRCVMAVLSGNEESAEKAVDTAEAGADAAAKLSTYRRAYTALGDKHREVEVKVYSDENPQTGKTYMRAMLVGKESCLDNHPYRPQVEKQPSIFDEGTVDITDETVPF